MGGNIDDKDIQAIKTLAKTIQEMQKTQQQINQYIETKLSTLCQNTTTIIGTILTAKLLTIAGSLKKLATMPASTIQLLGAEKALFRNIKQGTKIPKYGIISQHPLIQKQSMKLHGKAARKLADKIAITAKIDYFKGTFIGDKIKKELEKKLS